MEGVPIDDAKQTDLENLKRNHGYDEVPYSGRKCISIRGVFTKNGKNIVKARLVARRFEEVDILQVDCPTCIFEWLLLSWYLNNGNVMILMPCTFLQGMQIDWLVFIEPPPELKGAGTIWKLIVCAYHCTENHIFFLQTS